ncbi:MAG: C_GCAxxG_C_C family protein [Nitrospirae bacterium]|nr:C_GCAxxG_C_C family protein [Nitrospirota bacterium]
MNRTDTATSLFKKGYDCSQSVLAAFDDVTGIDRDTSLKLGSPFAGGMGKMGDTCGAVTGALMVIGLKHGATDPADKKTKEKVHGLVNEFVEKFRSLSSSTICRDIIGLDIKTIGRLSSGERKDVHTKCLKCVQDAVEILEEIL